jgi:hypothetical protein
VSGHACPITVATLAPPAVPCSTAVRRRRRDALGERRIDIVIAGDRFTIDDAGARAQASQRIDDQREAMGEVIAGAIRERGQD